MPRVSFHTLGCKLNFAETSSLRRDFETRGFSIVPFGEQAEVAVINTCTVTAEADRKCRQLIRRARRQSPEACIIVTGCYAQLRPEEIAASTEVDYVLGNQEKARLFDLVADFKRRAQTQVDVSCIDDRAHFDAAQWSSERTRAFLKIQDGCDYSCAFCTIPRARGKSRSSAASDILTQARDLAARGIREIVLTGVNVGLYGQGTLDKSRDIHLLPLLRMLATVDGIARYRISSIEPNLLTREIIDFVADAPNFVPHFHIPLQSGDNRVLGAMRRRYRREVYAQRAAWIMDSMPDACIGADVIVGYPAETSERFSSTCQFLSDLPIAYLHAFTYSERPDTAAANMKEADCPSVPMEVRAKRNRVLRRLSARKRRAFFDRHSGSVRPVLWERKARGDRMRGFTDNYIRVERQHDVARAGQIEHVVLGSARAQFSS